MRFIFMFIIAVCVLLFLIKLRWLNNRTIYDKVGKYQTPPKIPGPKLNPPPPKILCPYLLRHANSKLIKIKLLAANVFIKGMFQVLNLQCLFNFYNGYQTFLLPIYQSGPIFRLWLKLRINPSKGSLLPGIVSLSQLPSWSECDCFILWLLFLDNVDNSKYCGCTKNNFPHCNCCSDFKEVSYKGIIVSK